MSYPGCDSTRFVDAHHLHHWADGGETSLNNLVLLCKFHHRLVHEGGFSVARTVNKVKTGSVPLLSGQIRFHIANIYSRNMCSEELRVQLKRGLSPFYPAPGYGYFWPQQDVLLSFM